MKWTLGTRITEVFLESVMSIQRIGHCTGFFPFGERQLTRIPTCAQRISRAVQEERDNSGCRCVYHVLFHSILHSWGKIPEPHRAFSLSICNFCRAIKGHRRKLMNMIIQLVYLVQATPALRAKWPSARNGNYYNGAM